MQLKKSNWHQLYGRSRYFSADSFCIPNGAHWCGFAWSGLVVTGTDGTKRMLSTHIWGLSTERFSYILNYIIMSDWSTKGVCLVITSPPKRTWQGTQSCMCSVVGNNKKCDITLAVIFYLFGHSDHWMSGKALAFLHLMSADMLQIPIA